MLDKDRWEQIAASLSGNLSDVGEHNLQSWISSSDEHQQLYDQAKLIWNNSGRKFKLEDVSTEKQWEDLMPFLEEDQPANQTIFRSSTTWLKIAASITLFSICLYAFQLFYKARTTTFVANEEVRTLYLPDSTRIWLNAHSTLSYTSDFNEDSRSVELDGEAFFAVKRDTSRKFIVTTEFAVVQVLGTSFNVQASDSISTTLTVAEGLVKFSSKKDQQKEEHVRAQEKAVYNRTSHKLVKAQNDRNDFASWRERNNPAYESEKSEPAKYLKNVHTWKKNPINQSVIEGKITNKALLATYSQIVLKITYTNPAGKNIVTHVTISDTIKPGQTTDFTKRLLDIFTDTQSLQIDVESANVMTDSIY